MGEDIKIIPMATIMMLGPQILSSLFILTGANRIKASLAYILSIFLAAALGTFIIMLIIGLFHISVPQENMSSLIITILRYALAILLAYGIYRNYRNRHKKVTPKWMKIIMAGNARNNAKLGFLLVFTAPTDLTVMTSVAFYLSLHNKSLIDAVPFLLTTALIAALPLIISLVFHKWSKKFLPKANAWLTENSWMVQVFVLGLFIYIILT